MSFTSFLNNISICTYQQDVHLFTKTSLRKYFIKAASLFCLIILAGGCTNHVDEYKVNADSLETLPDGFYAHRHGCVYVEDNELRKYRTWYSLNESGNIQDIINIDDFKNFGHIPSSDKAAVISRYNIDTAGNKIIVQRFIDLSRRFRFGHISIDRKNKIFFSHKDGLAEQYVLALNDSVKNSYLQKEGFKLLKNGWFENTTE